MQPSERRIPNTMSLQNERRMPSSTELFHYSKPITNFTDFKNTWKNIPFTFQLNQLSPGEVASFWEPHLSALSKQQERICILLPAQVDSPSKNGDKGAKVRLTERFIEGSMRVVQKYSELSCDYASLFLDKDKQLLIYRQCSSIRKFIERYRLPENYKKITEEVEKVAEEIFDLTLLRNVAISTFQNQDIKRLTHKIEGIQPIYQSRLKSLLQLLSKILLDFKAKSKCTELVLHSVRDNLKPRLQKLCEEQELYLTNRYYGCHNDQFKDLLISKQPAEIEEEFIEEDLVMEKPRFPSVTNEPQAPKQIEYLRFLSRTKDAYLYHMKVPKNQNNPILGVFVRSKSAEYEYFKETTELDFDIQIKAYREGYCTYQLYTYNAVSSTKCRETIEFYNQLPFRAIGQKQYTSPIKDSSNYSIFVQGTSTDLIPESIAAEAVSTFGKLVHVAHDVSVGSALYVCDAQGDVAGWGLMYEFQEQKNEPQESGVEVDLQKHRYSLQEPCLILSKHSIRQLSAGSGYALFLDIFGCIWGTGINNMGQLGLGHDRTDQSNMDPQKVEKVLPFMVSVTATESGASFSLDKDKNIYRWGFNQVEQTHQEVLDRFGTVINYTVKELQYKCIDPHVVNNKHITGNISFIQSGMDAYMALDTNGVLYGWGITALLGIGELKDTHENEVKYIVNPIEIRKNIVSISVGYDHSVAVTKDKRVLVWGNIGNKLERKPVDVTAILNWNGERVKAGHQCTIVAAEGFVKVWSNEVLLLKDSQIDYCFSQAIHKIQCGRGVIAILAR